jgi:hypothetical protein
LWLVPLLAVMSSRVHRPAGLVSMTALLLLISGFLLLAGYGALQELDILAVILLGLRNALLSTLAVFLVWRAPTARGARPRSVALTLGLLAVLAVDLNFREVTGGDFWFHRAVGNDILTSGAIPRTDTYSATAIGASFVAHEWLSSIAIAGTDRLFGPTGLFLLRAGAVFAVAVLMVLALSRRDRRSFIVIPAAVLAVLVVEIRAELRPHLLALVVIAALGLALAKWRRRGNWGPLWALVPLHVLWANLHGSCFLGPSVLFTLGAIAWVAPIRRRLFRTTQVPRDAVQLFVIAACTFLACMINPRGPRLFTFAFDLAFKSDFIRGYVDEWRGAFETYTPSAQMVSYFLLVGVAWLAIALGGRSRARPFQVGLAVVVTWLSLRAVRFQAEAAVLLFPIAVERLGWLVRRLRARDVRTSAIFDAALVFTVCLFGVFAFRDDLGIGYDRTRPQVAAEILRARQARVVFCEYEDGGFLIDQLRPEVKVVIDGRIDVYGAERVAAYRRANEDMAAFDTYVALHQIDAVLLRVGVGVPNVKLFRHLTASPQTWKLVDDGERHVLFLREAEPETASPVEASPR